MVWASKVLGLRLIGFRIWGFSVFRVLGFRYFGFRARFCTVGFLWFLVWGSGVGFQGLGFGFGGFGVSDFLGFRVCRRWVLGFVSTIGKWCFFFLLWPRRVFLDPM